MCLPKVLVSSQQPFKDTNVSHQVQNEKSTYKYQIISTAVILKGNRKQRVENVENYRNSFALLHQLPPSTLFPSYFDAQSSMPDFQNKSLLHNGLVRFRRTKYWLCLGRDRTFGQN